LKSEGRLLALDYGSVRVGLALSDPLRILARPAGVLPRSPALISTIQGLIEQESVCLVVVGVPYAPDGGLGAKGTEVMHFVEDLRKAVTVPVDTWDESGTSVDARALMIRSGKKKKQREHKGSVDERAAALLLQQYIEAHGKN
jgi:putative holliday junction resolvase